MRHLQAFVAVAEELHFGRAAARLQLSPSPVSRTVLELERELGVQLFIRGHHRVQLTEPGVALLPDARQLLNSWTAFTARGRALGRNTTTPRIRIGSPSLAPSEVIDEVVAVLSDLSPNIPVDVEFATSVELLAALRRRELDFVVAHLPLDDADLHAMPLARYRVGVVVPSDHELAQRTQVLPEDLAGRRVLQLSSRLQPTTMNRVTRWLTGLGAIVEELPDSDLVRLAQLVRHGRGVTLSGTTGVAAQVFAQPGLTVVPMGDTGPGIELGLVWPAGADATPLTEGLISRLAALVSTGSLRI